MTLRAPVPVLVLVVFVASLPPLCAATAPAALAEEIDVAELERHTRAIVRHARPSGSPGENAAIDYIVETLRADGIPVEVHAFPAYVSDPVRCALRVVGSDERAIECKTQALAAPSPPGGLEATLVDCGAGTAEDYARCGPEGNVVLVDGLAYPWGVKAAEDAGAAGVLFASPVERIHELTVSPVWGTPTHRTAAELPSIPSAAIGKSDGERLRERLAAGRVRVRLETAVATGWKTLRLAVAHVPGGGDPEGYVLLGGHIDAWHHGANDEGASNAAMLAMARLFYRHRGELERGLKVAWWPGHSNGRYAGSTWFVDRFWTELRDDAFAYLNIDGIGQTGAVAYGISATPEMDELARDVLREVAGATDVAPRRPGRNSDESFYGVGLPLLQFHHGRRDPVGGYWWWHTEEDTIDKVDFDVLAGDTRLYVAALERLLTAPVPPVRLAAATGEMARLVAERREKAGSHLDLAAAAERVERLHNLAARLDERLGRGETGGLPPAEIVRGLVRILRPLIRVTYQSSGPYHQDPALPIPTLPGLAPLDELLRHEPGTDAYGFTRAYLVREANRLVDHLDQALAAAETLAGALTTPAPSGRP